MTTVKKASTKILLFLLTFVLLLSFTSCGNSQDPAGSSSSVGSVPAGDAFVKPENYAFVLSASIDPHIRVYIDANGTVLAVEATNEDAKGPLADLHTQNVDHLTVIEEFISAAKAKGFIGDGAKIELTMR